MATANKMHARRYARRKALQALYQWEYTQDSASELLKQFQASQEDMHKVDLEYFSELLEGVIKHQPSLDAALEPHLDRKIIHVDCIERELLRLAMYEFKHRLDVPYRVVINEAVELAKLFGAEQAHKFINGVLDQVAKIERAVEFEAA